MICRSLVSLAALAVILAVVAAVDAPASDPPVPTPTDADFELRLELKPLPAGVRRIRLASDDDGAVWYVVELLDGGRERWRPDELAARLVRDNRHRGFLFRLLNITSPVGFAWVALGLAGQVLFTGRMVLQWLISERSRRSTVPVGFWWMSLAGASMLLVYFVWRRDIVGVLGQSAGWLIYIRNLWLIAAERRAAHRPTADAPAA